jgi:hypothetical protein
MTASIASLREGKKQLRIANKTLKTWKPETNFGPEGEYAGNSLKSGVDAILVDLSSFLQTDTKLIKDTTHQERTSLANTITKLSDAITLKNGSQIATHIDEMKALLRPYNLRTSPERTNEFISHCDHLQRRATELSITIQNSEDTLAHLNEIIETSREKNEDLQTRISELEEAINGLPLQINSLAEKNSAADESLALIVKAKESAKETLSQTKDSNSVIENFSKKISQREIELEKQAEKTELYEDHLVSYQKQHDQLLEKTENLINKSRQALGYATAEGLSAAFQQHHDVTKNDWAAKGWVFSAAVFIFLAIGIGIWVASDSSQNSSLPLIIGRLTLIPLCVAGSWFSAAQFVKLKNLAEDYAYKSALAKSLIGFSEQIRQSGENPASHTTYLQQVLNEIHKDPLRHRAEKSQRDDPVPLSTKELFEQLSAIRDEIKALATTERVA